MASPVIVQHPVDHTSQPPFSLTPPPSHKDPKQPKQQQQQEGKQATMPPPRTPPQSPPQHSTKEVKEMEIESSSSSSSAVPAQGPPTGAGKKVVIHKLGCGQRGAKRAIIIEYQSSCKRVKTCVAEVVLSRDSHSQPAPPARIAPAPLVVCMQPLPPSSAASRATKSMKNIDAQVVTSPTTTSTSTSTTAAAAAPLSSSSSSTAAAAAATPTPSSTRTRSSSATSSPRDTTLAQTLKLEEPTPLTEATTTTLATLTQALSTEGYQGLAELLTFLLHVQVQSKDHSTLFFQIMEILQQEASLRKDLCDFEGVFDITNPVYGKQPSAIFQELQADGSPIRFPLHEVYHEYLFMRLFVHFVVTRLQLVREWVVEVGRGGEELALVDGLLKVWWKRAYQYV